MKRVSVVGVAACVLLLAGLVTAGDLPGTPAGQRAGEVIGLLNGAGSLDPAEYIQESYAPQFRDAFPIATHEGIFKTTKIMFGRLLVAGIPESTPHGISVLLKSEGKDAWLELIIEVEPEDPHRIATMGLRPGSRPDDYEEGGKEPAAPAGTAGKPPEKPEKTSEAHFSSLEELDRYLREREEANEFSGAVLVAKGGEPLFHEAYGYASKRFGVPNRRDTKFNLGSCNKTFTAVAVAQLAEKGKLSLDDPIGKYLEGFPSEIAGKVTVRHLLNMRSGWGDYWGNEYFLAHITRLRTVSDYMEFIKDMPLDFEPGTNFQHSNTGFIVAGAVIEAVTGMDYYEYIRENIYDPAGMSNTDCYDKDGPVENLAMGYTNMNRSDPDGTGYEWNNIYTLPPRGSPAGGGYSTTQDLLGFDRALRGFTLLGPGYTGYYLGRFEGSPGGSFTPPGKLYRIAGAAPGINAYIAMDFTSDYTVIVLSNYDFPIAMEIGAEIVGMLGIE